MTTTAPTCTHFFLADDEICEACGKTPAQIRAEQREQDRVDFVAGLRELADWIEAHPEFPGHWTPERILFPVDTKQELADAARSLGRVTKYGDDDCFGIKRRFGRLIEIDIYGRRGEVCTRIVKGTREIVREVPDPDAPRVTVTETVEDVEWICEPLLSAVPEEQSS